MRADTVIIGSGISGLTAAAMLSKNKRTVTVIEKDHRIGGAIKRFKRKGVAFDVGFHYSGCLGRNQILHGLWNYCGAFEHLTIHPFPAEGADRLFPNNYPEPIDAFFSYDLFKEELYSHFPKEKEAIDSYFSLVMRCCDTIPFYNTSLPLSDFLKGFRASPLSVADYIRTLTATPALQAAFSAPSLLYGIPTDQTSIDIHAMVAHGYYSGAYSIAGGGQAIVDAFEKCCTDNGVTFITGDPVRCIVNDSEGVKEVHTEKGRQIPCKNVIYTGHPSYLPQLVDRSVFRKAYINRLLNLENTVSMTIVFGIVDKSVPDLEWKNQIYLPTGCNPLDNKNRAIKNRLLMVTSTERGDYNLSHDSKSIILLQPTFWKDIEQFKEVEYGKRTASYVNYKETVCKSMIERVHKAWRGQSTTIHPVAVGTPLTLHDELHAPSGCAYGASHSLNQYTPDVRTKLPGLYLSGQSTLMTGVVGSSLSGFVSAGHILGLESLWQELQQWL